MAILFPGPEQQDVVEALQGFWGWYSAPDLYIRYCDRAKANGREPAALREFVRDVARVGYQRRFLDKVPCFLVSCAGERFEAEEIEPVTLPEPRRTPPRVFPASD